MAFIDLVLGGPDLSGTTTQIEDIIAFFQEQGRKVRDIRGTEIDALFHAEKFIGFNTGLGRYRQGILSLKKFIADPTISDGEKREFVFLANQLLIGGGTNEDLQVASMVRNDIITYIPPESAEVWIMEEPPKRGAGQTNRTFEQQRTKYGSQIHPVSAAHCHQTYRSDEFFRFRKILRETEKIIVRSRSEESACYQIYDPKHLSQGISREHYLRLPGHQFAFGHPPTHLFIVCGPENWTEADYLELKKQRSAGRKLDDHELNPAYQVLVNHRYATNWLEQLYQEGCKLYRAEPPKIYRFSIYDSKEAIKAQMTARLREILKE